MHKKPSSWVRSSRSTWATSSLTVLGQTFELTPAVAVTIGAKRIKASDALQVVHPGTYISVVGTDNPSGRPIAKEILVFRRPYVPGANDVFISGLVTAYDSSTGQAKIGNLQVDVTPMFASNSSFAIAVGSRIEVFGRQAIAGGVVWANEFKLLNSGSGTSTQSISGTGTQSISGTGTQSISGTGTQSISGTGTQSISGTGTQSISGTGTEQSISGTGEHTEHLGDRHAKHLGHWRHAEHLGHRHTEHLGHRHAEHLGHWHTEHLGHRHAEHLGHRHAEHLGHRRTEHLGHSAHRASRAPARRASRAPARRASRALASAQSISGTGTQSISGTGTQSISGTGTAKHLGHWHTEHLGHWHSRASRAPARARRSIRRWADAANSRNSLFEKVSSVPATAASLSSCESSQLLNANRLGLACPSSNPTRATPRIISSRNRFLFTTSRWIAPPATPGIPVMQGAFLLISTSNRILAHTLQSLSTQFENELSQYLRQGRMLRMCARQF